MRLITSRPSFWIVSALDNVISAAGRSSLRMTKASCAPQRLKIFRRAILVNLTAAVSMRWAPDQWKKESREIRARNLCRSTTVGRMNSSPNLTDTGREIHAECSKTFKPGFQINYGRRTEHMTVLTNIRSRGVYWAPMIFGPIWRANDWAVIGRQISLLPWGLDHLVKSPGKSPLRQLTGCSNLWPTPM